MGARISVLALVSLICGSLSGCLFSEDKGEQFDLDVVISATTGVIVEKYVDGDLESTSYVEIEFNFTSTEIELKKIGVDTKDGSVPIELDGSTNSSIVMKFTSHGKYNVSVYALSSDNNRQSLTIPITVDLRIEWIENGTVDPKVLNFNPIPNNGGEHPQMIEVISTVTNPGIFEDFSGGQSVQFSWTITDELGDTCQKNSAVVNDGDSETWETIHFNTYLIHDLGIVYEDGQDRINVNHSLSLIYKS